MLGLAYDSSSDEEGQGQQPAQQPEKTEAPKQLPTEPDVPQPAPSTEQLHPEPQAQQTIAADAPLVGPSLPPDHLSRSQLPSDHATPIRTSSPFSTTRALIRDMTLPPIPNLDIPPSPPGSPDPTANKKFAHFLTLKKNGVHFNEKLSSSSSLRNPSLLAKMMEHAGIEQSAQYATSLPSEIWDVSSLPAWGFKGELNRSWREIKKKREGLKREAVEFVPASAADSGREAPVGGKGARGKEGRSESSRTVEVERRPGRRDRSRSPRRRRSRSR